MKILEVKCISKIIYIKNHIIEKIKPSSNNDKILIKHDKHSKHSKFIHLKYNYSYNSKINFFHQLKIFLNLEKKDYMYSDKLFDNFFRTKIIT